MNSAFLILAALPFENMDIWQLLQTTVNILAIAVAVVAVLSLVFAGFQYMTARDNAQQVSDAKQRIAAVIVSLLLFAFTYALIQWLIPGGSVFS